MAAEPREVIVVDDASTDNSVEAINRFPVKLIQNEENLGPTKSRNIGAKYATGDYILFLDGDAAAEPDYVRRLAEFLDANPKAGVVSGKIIESETGERMWYSFGYDPNFFREVPTKIFQAVFLKFRHNSFLAFMALPFTLNLIEDSRRKMDWVVEMAFMTRRDLFEKLGGLDERFYMFYEGPDYCRRARYAGYEVWYIPDSFVTHLGGHTHSGIRERLRLTSRLKYFKKYLFKI